MNLSKRLLTLALVVPLLFVSACSDEETPGQTPSPKNSSPGSGVSSSIPSPSSPDSSPSASGEYKPASLEHPAQNVPVPQYPEAGKKDNKEGREAAVDYFMDALVYAKETGKRTALDEVSFPDCRECWTYQENAEAFYASGGWVISGPDLSRKYQEQPEVDIHGHYKINYVAVEHENKVVYPRSSNRKPKIQKSNEAKGTVWVQYWPVKNRNVVVKFESYSIEEVK